MKRIEFFNATNLAAATAGRYPGVCPKMLR
jgi:hypothetical protein